MSFASENSTDFAFFGEKNHLIFNISKLKKNPLITPKLRWLLLPSSSQLTLHYKTKPFTLGVQNRGRGSVTVPRTKRTKRRSWIDSPVRTIDRKARWRCLNYLKSGGYKCHWSGLDCMLRRWRRWIDSHIRIIDLSIQTWKVYGGGVSTIWSVEDVINPDLIACCRSHHE
jgi:hypothetical protein